MASDQEKSQVSEKTIFNLLKSKSQKLCINSCYGIDQEDLESLAQEIASEIDNPPAPKESLPGLTVQANEEVTAFMRILAEETGGDETKMEELLKRPLVLMGLGAKWALEKPPLESPKGLGVQPDIKETLQLVFHRTKALRQQVGQKESTWLTQHLGQTLKIIDQALERSRNLALKLTESSVSDQYAKSETKCAFCENIVHENNHLRYLNDGLEKENEELRHQSHTTVGNCEMFDAYYKTCEVENGQLQERIAELEAELKAKGVACLEGHDLTHYVQCGHCFDKLQERIEALTTDCESWKRTHSITLEAANERIAELEKVLDEKSFTRYSLLKLKKYKEQVEALEKELSSVLKSSGTHIEMLRVQTGRLEKENAELKSQECGLVKHSQLNATNEALRELNQTLAKRIEALEKTNDRLSTDLVNREAVLGQAKDRIEALESKLQKTFESEQYFQNQADERRERIAELEKERDELKAEVTKLREGLEKVWDAINDIPQDCDRTKPIRLIRELLAPKKEGI